MSDQYIKMFERVQQAEREARLHLARDHPTHDTGGILAVKQKASNERGYNAEGFLDHEAAVCLLGGSRLKVDHPCWAGSAKLGTAPGLADVCQGNQPSSVPS